MDQNESSMVVRILGAALRFGALPFTWPAAALRRPRLTLDARGRAAEHAKFNTRNWTPELLKNLEWRRFEEICAAYFEALGYATLVSPARAGGLDIGLCTGGSGTPSVLVHCKPWDAYRVGIKPM